MEIKYPYTIDNGHGEKIVFLSAENEADGEKVIVENFVSPGAGPVMHTHLVQDERLLLSAEK